MVKIRKKFRTVGAPLYMSQFTMIMLILIVFFMVMVTMNQQQKGVGKSGDPDMANNLGLNLDTESIGLFRFGATKAGQQSPNPPAATEKNVRKGTHKSLVDGAGGQGDTDVEYQKNKYGHYIVVKFPDEFPKGKSEITPKMQTELEKYGTIFSLIQSPFVIKCRTREMNNAPANVALSVKRAFQIMRFFNIKSNISYSRMECAGTITSRYLRETPLEQNDETGLPRKTIPESDTVQETYFIIYLDSNKTLDAS